MSCKSACQNPNALKRKRKSKTDWVEASRLNAIRFEASQVDASQVNASQFDACQVDASQIESSEIEATQVESSVVEASQAKLIPKKNKVVHKPHNKVQKPIVKLRKRSSERLKVKWFQKPIIGHGLNSDQPITLI
ncbi:unnamed protein product [Lathyrus oleraceus]